jgi:hypothetical protein
VAPLRVIAVAPGRASFEIATEFGVGEVLDAPCSGEAVVRPDVGERQSASLNLQLRQGVPGIFERVESDPLLSAEIEIHPSTGVCVLVTHKTRVRLSRQLCNSPAECQGFFMRRYAVE